MKETLKMAWSSQQLFFVSISKTCCCVRIQGKGLDEYVPARNKGDNHSLAAEALSRIRQVNSD